MKKFVLWLIKVFKLDIVTEVTNEVIKEVYLDQVHNGDLTIKGNLVVEGRLTVTKGITCYVI